MRPRPVISALGTTAILMAAAPGTSAAQETPGLRPADLYRIVEAGEPAVAPDGGMVAFSVARPRRGTNEVRREIWIQELDGAEPVGSPVRFTDSSEDSHRPRWSPDGSLLSFVSRRSGDSNPVWFLRLSGPGGEAFHLPGVEGPPIWSPNGEWIAFIAPVPPDADTAAAVTRAPETGSFGGRVVTHTPFRELPDGDDLAAPGERARRQLFVVPAEGGEPRVLTRLDHDVQEAVWTPDGDGLYFVADPEQDDPGSPGPSRQVWYVSLDEGRVHRVTGGPGGAWAPAVSPDGEWLAYVYARNATSELEIRVAELGRSGGLSGDSTTVTAGFDRDAGPPTWSPDGGSLLFLARDGGDRSLYRVGTRGGSLTLVVAGEREVGSVSYSVDGSVLAFTASTPTRPSELYVAEGDGSDEERATDLNGALLEDRELASPTPLSWEAEDGTEIEGWVVEPVSFQPGTTYPLVVTLHGDFHGAFGNGFLPTVQALAAAGYFVLYPNPRGSSGYGRDFRTATRERWGIVEKADVLAGVDAVLARYPEVDPERVGVTGEGYGGFLTAWLTATSDRFGAAVPIRPVSSWESWYGTSAARQIAERELSGPPWRRRSLYRRLSPFSYVENVTTPTLVLHDRGNARMPASEGEQWFAALRRRGVPSELVLYPDDARLESGELGPRARVDALARTVQWLDRWLAADGGDDRLSGPPGGP